MRTESKYFCGKCEHEFYYEDDCKEHEERCGILLKFCCDKCNKIIEYKSKEKYGVDFDYNYNKCWTLTTNHYRAGYGSKFDGSEFNINVCDDCLHEFIHTFENKDRLLNSGSNQYYDEQEYDYEEENEDEENQ